MEAIRPDNDACYAIYDIACLGRERESQGTADELPAQVLAAVRRHSQTYLAAPRIRHGINLQSTLVQCLEALHFPLHLLAEALHPALGELT